MRRTRIVPNGKPGVYEVERSPLEIGLAVALFTSVIGVGAWLSLGQIQLGRELSTMGGDIKSIRVEMVMRVQQRDAEHEQLVRADTVGAGERQTIVEHIAAIEMYLAESRRRSESNQAHQLSILEKLPVQKEKHR